MTAKRSTSKTGIMDGKYPLHDYYSRIYNRYDLVNRLFTFGLDEKWRRAAAAECLEPRPEKVLDLCCGTGDMAMAVSRASGGSAQVTGLDFNVSMLGAAREKASQQKMDGIEFVEGSAAAMPFADGAFDCLTIGFGFRNLIYDNDNARRHLGEMERVLKPGARLVVLESSVPACPLVRPFFKAYLKLVLVPLGGIVTGDWKAFRYLVRSTLGFYRAAELKDLLEEEGFDFVSIRTFLLGSANLIVARKR